MSYVGIDLAWGDRARTGLAVVDTAGRLVASGSGRTDDEIDAWLGTYAGAPRVVAVDAPLIVPNETGMRECERLVGVAYGRYGASCHASNRSRAYMNPPRAELLAERHGWEVDPASSGRPVCVEVYPHAALVGLLGLEWVVRYKKGRIEGRRSELIRLLDLMETWHILALETNVRWQEIRGVVSRSARPVDLDSVENEVDAVVCAYLAWLFDNDPGTLMAFGDIETGYIVAPPAPRHSARRPVSGTVAPDVRPPIEPPAESVEALSDRLLAFADARDWDQFHTPKNLAMAIAGEAGELAAELQWLDGEASRTAVIEDAALRERVSQEMADVLIYLVRLADVAQIDLLEVTGAKIDLNERRFPPLRAHRRPGASADSKMQE